MTASFNNRLSSVALFITMAAVIALVILRWWVPRVEQISKESHQASSAMQTSLVRASQMANHPWLGVTVFTLVIVATVWRVVAAKRLR